MTPSTRIIVNTIAQYCRSVITMALAFVTTRVVFRGLGVVDFGIFSVVAGFVTMLGFITNALVISTQRYISYFYGSGQKEETRKIFINSLFVHIVIVFLITVVFLLLRDVFVEHWLNIPSERTDAAYYVYMISVLMLAVTVLEAPFKALFIARENIVFISVVEVLDAIVKLLLIIFSFEVLGIDKLVMYSNVMVTVITVNLLVFSLYALINYEECTLRFKRDDINRKYIYGLTNFAGWTTIDTASAVLRSQGIAVILNNFLGAVINASFGIAMQIKTASSFVFTSILNAMTPQIMKAEGSGDRHQMVKLATMESKFSTAIMILTVYPIVFELPSLLTLWLGTEPVHASMFCTFLIIAFLADGISLGLHVANQALGNIGRYTLIMNVPKILSLILVWLALFCGYGVESVMWIYLIVEIAISLVRIPFTAKRASFPIRDYLRDAVYPLIILFVGITIYCELIVSFLDFKYRFVFTYITAVLVGSAIMWILLLDRKEKEYIKKTLHIGRSDNIN